MLRMVLSPFLFQSTLPVRGAIPAPGKHCCPWGFQSTLPVRGATRNPRRRRRGARISIHAPREGSDSLYKSPVQGRQYISIHAPREGSDSF